VPDPQDAQQILDALALTGATTAAAAMVARAGDARHARPALIPARQLKSAELLREHGGAAGEVEALVREVRSLLPESQETWVQNNITRDHGQVFASPGGNVILNQGPVGPVGTDISARDREDEGRQ
jgi:hypothetical protein